MKYKFKNWGTVKLQNAGNLPAFQRAVTAVQNRDAEAIEQAKKEAELLQQQQIAQNYNRLHNLPGNYQFVPSNGGAITERTGPLYSNKLEKYLDETASGQEMVRMADTAKKGIGLALAGFGGNWLWNGIKVAPLLTSGELIGGAAIGKLGQITGKGADDLLHTRNQILDFEKVMPFTGMIGGAKLGRSILENNTLRGAVEGFSQGIENINLQDTPLVKNILAGKIGWAPKQNKIIWHNSESPILKLKSTFPSWDVIERSAPLGHVWGTGIETKQGFIGSRPFHLRSTQPVEMNKPMVQLNEAIGDSKNAVRNEILKYADQSGADAINFSNIKDNTLSNQNVYAIFKDVDVKPKLSEAEHLGIPKGERSNPKALEDPQYWGYKQWNDRYNAAIESGNWNEVQRLRDLHFKIKAPDTKVVDENGMPLHTYHGLLDRTSPEKAIKFNKYEGVNWDVEDAVEQGSKINHWKLAVPTRDIMANYHSPNYDMVSRSYALGYKDLIYDDYLNITNPFTYDKEAIHNIVNNFKPGSSTKTLKIEPAHYSSRPSKDSNGNYIKDSRGNIVWGDSKLIPERHYYEYSGVSDWAYFGGSRKPLMQLGYDGLYIPQYYDSYGAFVSPSQFKSAEPITRTDIGEIIPIVKRDNFHNLDRRYKQGGILKGQEGTKKVPVKRENPRELIPVKGSKPQTPPYPSLQPYESFMDKLKRKWSEMKKETKRPNAFGKFVITKDGTIIVNNGGKIA